MSKLLDKITYKTNYFPEGINNFLTKVYNKTVVPYQVELQPGNTKSKEICWMKCPYCYGGSSEKVDEFIEKDRYISLINEISKGPNGDINKHVYAGYATDPLNCEFIDELVKASINNKKIIGIHSKLIKISDNLLNEISSIKYTKESYLTVSLDAGDNESYNKVHNLPIKSKIYDKVLNNLSIINKNVFNNESFLDVTVNYLLTPFNIDKKIISNAIKECENVGAKVIRFSFPQLPRGKDSFLQLQLFNRAEQIEIAKELNIFLKTIQSKISVIFSDFDSDIEIQKKRTHPCFARFLYPTISYDGFLSHCSQSSAFHFRNMSLGDLREKNFWDCYYDYDGETYDQLLKYLSSDFEKMQQNDCRCDRKEHAVNKMFSDIQ